MVIADKENPEEPVVDPIDTPIVGVEIEVTEVDILLKRLEMVLAEVAVDPLIRPTLKAEEPLVEVEPKDAVIDELDIEDMVSDELEPVTEVVLDELLFGVDEPELLLGEFRPANELMLEVVVDAETAPVLKLEEPLVEVVIPEMLLDELGEVTETVLNRPVVDELNRLLDEPVVDSESRPAPKLEVADEVVKMLVVPEPVLLVVEEVVKVLIVSEPITESGPKNGAAGKA
ncbi:uncharacterized protein Z519_05647 [Cladophialophora bantiana CBS 173.52]|uniref:Uncharacterized protein n=1 Tax=Cladophialophora bantiana (strain ATCC 10958 / CBS 173.52 / CDC B-1940 / NIH 8579) TaxID=1442370 RepID=A0A0D2EWT1_CLAB1|nr:uncharacterized protein Z519_05647 [Cladophialophora bantiana CBS 173.52]KIW94331.1 hypothetical protein Z519_05647 [Cladophialophora bantiana CBS 173.52]